MTMAAGLPVALGDCWVVLDAHAVREVLGRTTLIAVPRAASGLVGVVAWKGRAVAVLDLAPFLGLPALDSPRSRLVVLESDGDAIALPVDRVREARPIGEARPLHVARMVHATHEVDLGDGEVAAIFDHGSWLSHLSEGS